MIGLNKAGKSTLVEVLASGSFNEDLHATVIDPQLLPCKLVIRMAWCATIEQAQWPLIVLTASSTAEERTANCHSHVSILSYVGAQLWPC
jgi:GTPase SAR1 family protein